MNEDKRCEFPHGITVKPDGIHELDPCLYEDIVIYKNVTVIVSKCVRCGNISLSWKRQDNTEEILSGEDL